MMVRTLAAGLFLFAVLSHPQAQDTERFIARLNLMPQSARQAAADSFIRSAGKLPLIEHDSLAFFFFQGTAGEVAIAGDMTGWAPSIKMKNIAGTDLWSVTCTYPSDARLDYKIVVDGQKWITDPRNPNTCQGGYGPNSELRMGKNHPPPELFPAGNISRGSLTDTLFCSSILGNCRQVRVYLPAAYRDGAHYPLMLFHDGTDYLNLGSATATLDYLIAKGLVRPLIGIFVPPVDRDEEYAGTKKDMFSSFITKELMPWIDSRYSTSPDPVHRAMIGASNGGNIALYLGVNNPSCFGKIAAQSSNVIPPITEKLTKDPPPGLEYYIDIGTYDIPVLIPMVRDLARLLDAKGYRCDFREIHDGHSWGNWKEHLRLPLMQFFPPAETNKSSTKE
jgi:enterochelin esterase family protein